MDALKPLPSTFFVPLTTGSSLQDPQGGFAPRQASVLAGAPHRPCCILGVLTATLALSLVVCVALLMAERGQSKGTLGCGNASLACSCTGVGVRKSLCPLREGEGCMLCPTNWTLRGTKCYWVSAGINPWSVSREDCVKRGAELLMLGDQDELVKGPVASGMWDGAGGTWGRAEGLPRNLGSAPGPGCLRVGDAGGALSWDTGAGACFGMVACGTSASPPAPSAIQDFLNKIPRKPAGYFWIGLYAGDGWTWLNGSRLDPSR
ncbi:uncharacterized protein LOC134507852 isoform X1 [Chroicocephalus ridibundus]|uniref:uncharacterized protein LOC134507852 isoform X1 n=1 Tax=Chroicocephalus ridibundus TaxID=1192867 RepID=UPI002FDCC051